MLGRSEEQAKLTEALKKQVDSVASGQDVKLSEIEKGEIIEAMIPLCSNISLWFGGGAEARVYQMNIAESPRAVTGKEFDEFVAAWRPAPSPETAEKWIANHSAEVERLRTDVYRELLAAALNRYPRILGAADSVRREEDRSLLLDEARMLIGIIECLLLKMGPIGQPDGRIGSEQLEQIFDSLTNILKSSPLPAGEFCYRNEALLNHIIEGWQGDVTPLTAVILPYGHWGSDRFDGQSARALHERLSKAILPKLTSQVIAGFREGGYVQRAHAQSTDSHQIRCLLLSPDSPLWKEGRAQLLATIQEAPTVEAVQENAYELLHWFELLLAERGETGDAANLKKLFLDTDLLGALWAAAAASPLGPYWTVRLNNFYLSLKQIGIKVALALSVSFS